MLCLALFVHLFLVPYPQAPTALLVGLLALFVIEHKPCIYCSALILALLCSSCSLYGDSATGSRCWLDLDTDWLLVPRMSHMVYL
ncbi:hypothetical protein HK105_202706 [Polyrhizophydium stewartii]|uniref:Bladder cancer-associated protein n=1 Tax=Polyrhizophydium stewartii TaxID=2732419 RepID=A0ABR4NE76_9FUNG